MARREVMDGSGRKPPLQPPSSHRLQPCLARPEKPVARAASAQAIPQALFMQMVVGLDIKRTF